MEETCSKASRPTSRCRRRGLWSLSLQRQPPASDLERYSNAHNAEAAVALYERAEDGLRCCHDFALNNSEIRSRLLQIALDHGMVP
jgi:hypothetical protein